MKSKLLLFSFIILTLFSCKKKEEDQQNPIVNVTDDNGYLHGRYIVNEGNFLSNNGSISFIGNDGLVNDVYQMVNGVELGDVLQSFTIIGDNGYAVLNNSQKIVVVDLKSMQHITSITGLDYPRYLIDGGNGFAYVSNGSGSGKVYMIDLSNHTLAGSIDVGKGPEKMIKVDDHIFVCNSGGWELDASLSVIDVNTNTVTNTIAVGDRPMDLVQDNSGDIWVMCSGNDSWMSGGETMASLVRLNSSGMSVETTISIGSAGVHPKNIAANAEGTIIYYDLNGVESISLGSDEPTVATFHADAVGSIDVDPSTGDVWTSSVSDYVNPSVVTHRRANGELVGTYTAGLITNSVVFH